VHVTVQQLAALVQGQVHGDGGLVIHAARPMSEAGPHDLTFIENDRHVRSLKDCQAPAAVVPEALVARRAELLSARAEALTLIQVRDPLAAFSVIVRHLHGRPEPPPHGIDPLASVHPTARLGPEPSVHPFACIGAGTTVGARCRLHPGAVVGRFCKLGDDVTLHPHAVLYDGTVLGDRVIVHAHAVLGADGFGYRLQDGRHIKVPQFGHVEVADDVEIGAGTAVDRGTFQATRIGAGTKIDNLVQVGHNCQVGKHNLFVSQVGLAGSSSTGDFVVIAGQAGVVSHVHIGTGAVVGGQSGVTKNVPDGQRVLGCPAIPEREQKRALMSFEKLPEIRKDVLALKRHLGLETTENGHA
jgi:UDP-3-O-[3-hydroxymyristoyl] glucosamine N-acyltransferase